MAPLSPSARALRDLQRAIHRYSGKALGDVARRAVCDHADDPRADQRWLTAWLWSDIGDASPESFVHPPSEQHSMLGMATLYSLRTAPTTIERLALTPAERGLVRRTRRVVAELSGVDDLVTRRWRHLVGLRGSPLALTFVTAAPGAAAAALCREPGLGRTVVWADGTLPNLRAHFDAAEVAAQVIHEEMHLALGLRVAHSPDALTPLGLAGAELAAEVGQAITALSARGQALTRESMLEYLRDEAWVAAPVVELLPKQTSVAAAARTMVVLSTAAQQSDDELVAVTRSQLGKSLSRRRLERLLGLV